MWTTTATKDAVVAREGQRRMVLRHQELLLVDFAAQGSRLARWYAAPQGALRALSDYATCEAFWWATCDPREQPERRTDGD